jgi:hypothetical protein
MGYNPSYHSPNSHVTSENRPDILNTVAQSTPSYYDRGGASNTIPPKAPTNRVPRKSNINSLLSDTTTTYSPRESTPQQPSQPSQPSQSQDHHFSRPPIVHPNSNQTTQSYTFHHQSNASHPAIPPHQENNVHQPRMSLHLNHENRAPQFDIRNGANQSLGYQYHNREPVLPQARQPINLKFTPNLSTPQQPQAHRKPTPFQDPHNILSNTAPQTYNNPNVQPDPAPPKPATPAPQQNSRRGKGSISHLLN